LKSSFDSWITKPKEKKRKYDAIEPAVSAGYRTATAQQMK